MQILEGGGTENDEDAHPEGGALVGDRLSKEFLLFFFCLLTGRLVFKDDGVEIDRHDTEHEGKFDEQDREVFRILCNAGAGLGNHELTDIVQVDAAGEENDEEDNPDRPLIPAVEGVNNRLHVFLGNSFL